MEDVKDRSKWQKESQMSSQCLSPPVAQKVQNGEVKVVEEQSNLTRFRLRFGLFNSGLPVERPWELTTNFCHFGPEGPKSPLQQGQRIPGQEGRP